MSDWIRNERGNLVRRYGPAPQPVARGGFPCPLVVSDSMDPLEHVDGRTYDSKSKFRAVTKAHGYIEVGNDPARFRTQSKPKADRAAIKNAVGKAIAKLGI